MIVKHVSKDWIMIRNSVDNKNNKCILNMPLEEFLMALTPAHEISIRRKPDGEVVKEAQRV